MPFTKLNAGPRMLRATLRGRGLLLVHTRPQRSQPSNRTLRSSMSNFQATVTRLPENHFPRHCQILLRTRQSPLPRTPRRCRRCWCNRRSHPCHFQRGPSRLPRTGSSCRWLGSKPLRSVSRMFPSSIVFVAHTLPRQGLEVR